MKFAEKEFFSVKIFTVIFLNVFQKFFIFLSKKIKGARRSLGETKVS